MEIADFSSVNGKGISESLPASYRNGVQQQLIPSSFEKMRSIKRTGSKSTRQIKKDFHFLSLKVWEHQGNQSAADILILNTLFIRI